MRRGKTKMDLLNNSKVNTDVLITFKFDDDEFLLEMMRKFGDINYPFVGNDVGTDDLVFISVSNDTIIKTTYQSNGWIRFNGYTWDSDEERMVREEWFNGRWHNKTEYSPFIEGVGLEPER